MLKERAKKVFPPVLGRFHQLEVESAKGCYLYDKQGNAYLDFGSGIAVTSTGHCHPEVVNAIKKQAESLIHPCIAIGDTDSVIQCAERLTGLLLPEHYNIFFDQSGTGAVEAALKLAKYVQKKHKIIAFKGGFHGRSMGSLSVTTSKMSYRENVGPMLDGVDFFPYPYAYRCPWNTDNYLSSVEASIKALENSHLFNEEVAAAIIEPVLGEGGYIPATSPFLQALEIICKRHNIFLILDEIQTGIGRTGHWFNFQKSSISPDIIVTAKGLGSGMPIAACLAKTEIMNQWEKGAHGGTYGGNPISCAAALATINVIEPLLPQVQNLSSICKDFLTSKLSDLQHVGEIRVEGLMIGIEFVLDKESKKPNTDIISYILSHALKKHLIVISCGMHSNVIRLAPPLIITEKELLHGLSILCEVIHDYY